MFCLSFPGYLKLTPMRLANIPPPMALHEVEINSNIIDVAITIRAIPRPSAIIGVIHHQGYTQFEWLLSLMVQSPPVCSFTNDFWSKTPDEITNRDRLYLQVSFSGNASLVFSKSVDKSTLSINGENGEDMGQLQLDGTNIEGMIRDSLGSQPKTYIVIDHDGTPISKDLEDSVQSFNDVSLNGIELTLLPFSSQRIDAVVCGFEVKHAVDRLANGTETRANKDVIFSLAENGTLFVNERRLAKNCTSFLVTPAHLIFTTSQHLLKFVHLMPDNEGRFLWTQSLASA